MKDHFFFSSTNNNLELQPGTFRVWFFGQSYIALDIQDAFAAKTKAKRLDPDAHIMDHLGRRVTQIVDGQPLTEEECEEAERYWKERRP